MSSNRFNHIFTIASTSLPPSQGGQSLQSKNCTSGLAAMAAILKASICWLWLATLFFLVVGQLSDPITRDEHVTKDNMNKFLSRQSTKDKEAIPEL